MLNTDISRLLKIKYPILQGGMAWVASSSLASAVSNAGGLGIIGAGNAPAEIIRKEVKNIKENTDKPFGVNVMLLSPFAEDIIQMIYEEKIPVVTTGAGNPGKYIKGLKEIGIKIIPVVPSVALAKKMEREGADAVIVEGTEAGGHIGELTTMALVPQVVDAVKIPVIAAGGIADGRGLVSAFALGAKGVQMGTRFVCSKECNVHANYKNAIIKAGDRSTGISGRATGHPVRIIKNKLYREFSNKEKNNASIGELIELGTGGLKKACVDGDVNMGSVMAGQISGLIKEIKSVEEIINDIVKESVRINDNINLIIGG